MLSANGDRLDRFVLSVKKIYKHLPGIHDNSIQISLTIRQSMMQQNHIMPSVMTRLTIGPHRSDGALCIAFEFLIMSSVQSINTGVLQKQCSCFLCSEELT